MMMRTHHRSGQRSVLRGVVAAPHRPRPHLPPCRTSRASSYFRIVKATTNPREKEYIYVCVRARYTLLLRSCALSCSSLGAQKFCPRCAMRPERAQARGASWSRRNFVNPKYFFFVFCDIEFCLRTKKVLFRLARLGE